MNEDRKPDEDSAETEDPVISLIKKFQIQIKEERKNVGLSSEENVEDKMTESHGEQDTKP